MVTSLHTLTLHDMNWASFFMSKGAYIKDIHEAERFMDAVKQHQLNGSVLFQYACNTMHQPYITNAIVVSLWADTISPISGYIPHFNDNGSWGYGLTVADKHERKLTTGLRYNMTPDDLVSSTAAFMIGGI